MMEENQKKEQSVRIQTSLLNGLEKKALVWLAERQPKWADSDMLTFVDLSAQLSLPWVLRCRTLACISFG